MVNLSVERIDEDSLESRVEIVERKGLGHPDTICDGIAEEISQRLREEYENRFGEILHYNVDEVQLVAGDTSPGFGGGEINERIHVLLAGRATKEFKGEGIPVDELAVEAAKNYIERNFKVLSSEHFEFESKIGETSTDLKEVFEREEESSNDTSFGVGYSPLSDAEKATLEIEKEIRGIQEVGEDIKIMTLREGEQTHVTVAAAVISRRVENMEDYRGVREDVHETTRRVARRYLENVEVAVNTADDLENEMVYITETGTSAENGDDGSVGRGNRLNGLITPGRPMTLEAHSGKNPRTHVGKINQERAKEIAEEIHEKTSEHAEATILNKIGQPINEPSKIHVKTAAPEDEVREVVNEFYN